MKKYGCFNISLGLDHLSGNKTQRFTTARNPATGHDKQFSDLNSVCL